MSASGVLALTLVVGACASKGQTGGAAGTADCQPIDARLPASVPWDSLAGSWRLTLVATSGQMAGHHVEGALTLRAQDSALRRVNRPGPATVTVPVIGATDIALEQVSATRLGDVQSTNPGQPGLAIWVSSSANGEISAVMRIGQEAIQSDVVRFDGGYTALFLRQVSPSAIRGTWASGVTTEQASGYFCAMRASAG